MNFGGKQGKEIKEIILFVLIVTAVLESSSLIGLVGHWRVRREASISPRQQHICFEWEKFTMVQNEEKGCPNRLQETFDTKTKLLQCCGDLGDVLDILAEKVLQERYDSDTNPELSCLNFTQYNCEIITKPQPMARLTNLRTDRTPVQVGMSSKLFWNHMAPSYVKSGLKYLTDDGTIYVEEAGNYFVSLHLNIKQNEIQENKKPNNVNKQTVHLISNGTDSVILEDVWTPCKTVCEEQERSSSLGAVFKLRQGDRLYVATSHPESITYTSHNNLFSMFTI